MILLLGKKKQTKKQNKTKKHTQKLDQRSFIYLDLHFKIRRCLRLYPLIFNAFGILSFFFPLNLDL